MKVDTRMIDLALENLENFATDDMVDLFNDQITTDELEHFCNNNMTKISKNNKLKDFISQVRLYDAKKDQKKLAEFKNYHNPKVDYEQKLKNKIIIKIKDLLENKDDKKIADINSLLYNFGKMEHSKCEIRALYPDFIAKPDRRFAAYDNNGQYCLTKGTVESLCQDKKAEAKFKAPDYEKLYTRLAAKILYETTKEGARVQSYLEDVIEKNKQPKKKVSFSDQDSIISVTRDNNNDDIKKTSNFFGYGAKFLKSLKGSKNTILTKEMLQI